MFVQPILQWKSSKYYIFWVRIYIFIYPAWNAHAPYYIVIYGLSDSTIFFPHYLINGKIFAKMLLNTKCVFWFSLQILSITFLILRRIQRDFIVNVHRSSCKVPVARFWWNLNILDRFFSKKKILAYQNSWKYGQTEERIRQTWRR